MTSSKTLVAEPADRTPDLGPRHRGGPFALFVAVFCAISATGAALLFWREGDRVLAATVALLLGASSLWAWWCLIERWREHSSLPRSHAVLTGTLAFDLRSTCRDVAATVFFYPDVIAPNTPTQLLCFVENYASRRRVAHFRIGPHAGLGLHNASTVSLALAAGQAAVYALPLTAASALAPGQHDLPITLKVDKPAGTGARLPGTPRVLYDLWTVHFAAPFTLVAAAGENTGVVPAQPRFLTLASASVPEPHLDRLEALFSAGSQPRRG